MNANLHIGDVVRPKLGGPAMTVARIQGDRVKCVWFGAYRYCERWFDELEVSRGEPTWH